MKKGQKMSEAQKSKIRAAHKQRKAKGKRAYHKKAKRPYRRFKEEMFVLTLDGKDRLVATTRPKASVKRAWFRSYPQAFRTIAFT